jgi:predicted homoserine dehydrogenase-like protein
MHLYRELRRRQQFGRVIKVAVSGVGAMGRGIALQLQAMHGVEPAILVSRSVERAVEVWLSMGVPRDEIVVSDDPRLVQVSVDQGLACVCRDSGAALSVEEIEVFIEATGSIDTGARSVLGAIHAGKHVIVMNTALDATLGCYLAERARQQGVVYGHGDGDQAGVMMRLLEWVDLIGFEVVAAVNRCENLDVRATPESARELAAQLKTYPRTACAMIDGTRMNLVNAIVSNATGLVPEVRGMHGIGNTRKEILRGIANTVGRSGVVEYCYGSEFDAGVFVIGRSNDYGRVGQYMDAWKIGAGPDYLFCRQHHLLHLEVPITVAEAVIYREPTIAPLGAPVADVVAVAKRNLKAGEMLDGIGGETFYGQIDTVDRARDFVPCGLALGAVLMQDVSADEPIPRDAVEFCIGDYALNLRRLQETLFSTFQPTPIPVYA